MSTPNQSPFIRESLYAKVSLIRMVLLSLNVVFSFRFRIPRQLIANVKNNNVWEWTFCNTTKEEQKGDVLDRREFESYTMSEGVAIPAQIPAA